MVKPAISVLRAFSVASNGLFSDGTVEGLEAGAVVVGIEILCEVGMRIDEAGEERGISEVNDGGTGGRIAADLADPSIRYNDQPIRYDGVRLAVKEARGLEYDDSSGLGVERACEGDRERGQQDENSHEHRG